MNEQILIVGSGNKAAYIAQKLIRQGITASTTVELPNNVNMKSIENFDLAADYCDNLNTKKKTHLSLFKMVYV